MINPEFLVTFVNNFSNTVSIILTRLFSKWIIHIIFYPLFFQYKNIIIRFYSKTKKNYVEEMVFVIFRK